RGSPCGCPAAPSGEPSSDTTPILRFVCAAQVCTACRISCCQRAVGPRALSIWKRVLGRPPTSVPSGTKLSVRWVPSGQGLFQTGGVRRVSSCSKERDRVRFIARSLVSCVRTSVLPLGSEKRVQNLSDQPEA